MIEELLDYVKKSDLEKGLEYSEKKVNYVGTSIDGEEVVHNFVVASEHTSKSYIVTVVENEEEEILDIDCTCPQFLLTDSCKHVAAVLVKYQGEMFFTNRKEKGNLQNQKMSLDLLEQIRNVVINHKSVVKKEAQLVPYLKLEQHYRYYGYYYEEDEGESYYTYELRFKVGSRKLYALGAKAASLVDRYYNGGTLRFGKDFVYNNQEYYFDDLGKKMMNFLEINYARTYRNDPYLLPNKQNLDQLFSMVDHIYVEAPSINQELPLLKGLPFQFKMIKEEGNHTLMVDDDLMDLKALSGDYSYLINRKGIYQLNPVERLFAKDILEEEENSFVFPDKALKDVKDYIIPNIKDHIQLDSSVDDIVLVKTPSVKLYFDLFEDYIEGKIIFTYGDLEINYFDQENTTLIRDKEFEREVFSSLIRLHFDDDLRLYDIDEIGNFLENEIDALAQKYEVFTSEKLKNTNLVKKVRGTASFGIGQDNILNYEFQLENVNPSELDDIFLSLKSKKKYFRLKSGDILDLRDPSLQELEELKEDFDLEEKGELPKFRALYLDSLKNKNHFIKTNSLFDAFVKNFKEYKNAPVPFTQEEEKLLRGYQKEGVKWLYNLYKCNLGGILADEMGLGKSLQTIIFLKRVLEEDSKAKTLIVCPTALVYNWDNEFKKFSDEIVRCLFVGPRNGRHNKLSSYEGNVYITSYGLLREDLELYQEMNFKVMVIDEAQNIKNPTALLTKAVKKIHSEVKLALTGTPIENSILELWSIFDYIMPGFLGNKTKFHEKYKISDDFDDMTNNTLTKLRSQVRPFILRRKKNEVLKDLPDKIENNIYIDLSEEEKKIYAALVKKTKEEMEELLKGGFTKNKMQILTLLTRLRQVCIDPKIIFDNFKKPSSKIEHLIEVVKEAVANGHKILLFTSFKTALNIVEENFTKEGLTSYVIDGSVSSKKRQELVDKFNEDDTNVFLIMLKSGGTGLNLTSADIVIHLDLWWNPQAENQATDRAHRIGQKKSVEVIKLITKGTIEEKILALQEKKKILSDKLIEKEGEESLSFQNLSVEDIRELLKFNNE